MSFSDLDGLVTQALTIIHAVSRDDGPSEETAAAMAPGALAWISRFSPYEDRAELAGNGSTYSITIPATWVPGFSRFKQIESPTGQRPPRFVEVQPRNATAPSVYLYPTTTAPTHIYFLTTPPSGQTVAVDFTALHTATTVPDNLEPVVEQLLAHMLAKLVSASFDYTNNPNNVADSNNYGGKGAQFEALAKTCLETASSIFGADLSAHTWAGSTRIGRL